MAQGHFHEILFEELKEAFEVKNEAALKRFVLLLADHVVSIREMKEELVKLGSRVEALSSRIDALAEAMKMGFEHVDKRFEDMNKRFDDINKRFNLLVWIVGIFIGLPTWVMVFLKLLGR